MEVVIILIAGALFFAWKTGVFKDTAGHTSKNTNTSKNQKQPPIPEWLQERWRIAASNKYSNLPEWYTKPATERQVQKLEELGYTANPTNLMRGTASDIIGLYEEADDESIKILKFFKVSTAKINETAARDAIDKIFSKESNIVLWEQRPLDAIHKEYCKLFSLKIPAGISYSKAISTVTAHKMNLPKNDPKLEKWNKLAEIYEELEDKEVREEFDIKKAPLSLIKQSIDALLAEGSALDELDISDIVEQMIELKPDIEH
jgi:hypothetical protein